jgi:serine/threonine protein kinase
MLLGTVAYLAPERLAGDPAGPASDLYSVGVLLYEALAGCLPFYGETPLALIASISDRDPPPLAGLRDDLAPAVVAIVERAMEKVPGERFDSAAAMAAAIADATDLPASPADMPTAPVARQVADVPTWSAPPETERGGQAVTGVLMDPDLAPERVGPSKTPRRTRRRFVVVAALLVTLFGVVLLAVVGLYGDHGTSNEPPSATTTSPASPIPPPLRRALDELDQATQP